jgi:hypothetical protein
MDDIFGLSGGKRHVENVEHNTGLQIGREGLSDDASRPGVEDDREAPHARRWSARRLSCRRHARLVSPMSKVTVRSVRTHAQAATRTSVLDYFSPDSKIDAPSVVNHCSHAVRGLGSQKTHCVFDPSCGPAPSLSPPWRGAFFGKPRRAAYRNEAWASISTSLRLMSYDRFPLRACPNPIWPLNGFGRSDSFRHPDGGGHALRWRRNDRDRFLRRFVSGIALVKSFLARGGPSPQGAGPPDVPEAVLALPRGSRRHGTPIGCRRARLRLKAREAGGLGSTSRTFGSSSAIAARDTYGALTSD